MESSIFRFVLRHSFRQQIMLTLMAAASFPFLYAFYEVPKAIVNDAIQGGTTFPVEIFGVELGQLAYLLVLCVLFLLLVVVNQSFKYSVNVYRGLTGERMLRRLRYELYSRVLRFPLPTFRKMSQGEIIPMITAEVEPLGGFIGDAFSLPAFQGGTLLVILAFLFIQDPLMAGAAVSLYPLQVYVIPKLQRRVNRLGKERVRLVRRLSDRIGETVQGVPEIRAHDTSNFALAHFSHQLGLIFGVRYAIYRQKFFIKFLNNFIQQLGPFFFYSIGGYLTITGSLEIGTLIAAIAAHKDLASPWKELLRYYQMKEDARIKYENVVSQFAPPGILDERSQIDDSHISTQLQGELNTANLTLTDEQETSVVDGVSFRFSLDQNVAIVGVNGSGKDELTLLLARLLDPSTGSISVSGKDLSSLSETVIGGRISYVGPQGFIFATTLGENLFFGLKHVPLIAPDYDSDQTLRREREVAEAERSGNNSFDIHADWIDYKAVGVGDLAALRQEALRVLKLVDLGPDIYDLGLRGAIDPDSHPEVAQSILKARRALRERVAKDPSISSLVETFDRETYNTNATVGENLLFGNPVGADFAMDSLAEDEYVLSVLDRAGLRDTMLSIGYQVASTMVELFADLPADHEFFQQFSFISSEDLPEFQGLLARVDRGQLNSVEVEDRIRLMSLPFKLITARHRLDLIDEDVQAKILDARAIFASNLPDGLKDSVEFYDDDRYNSKANLQDNILFGKVVYGEAHASDKVGELIAEVIRELDLEDTVGLVALDFDVGIGGSRLSGAQRQKLAIARAVLKAPDILILSEATASLDAAAQLRLSPALMQEFGDRCLIWSLNNPALAENFDHILVMHNGRVVEQGSYSDLKKDNTQFKQLLAAV